MDDTPVKDGVTLASLLENGGRKALSLVMFGREILANPRAMGAICPSSPALAAHMAAQVPLNQQGPVVELGGGTGTVTAALLKRGVRAQELVVIERSAKLATHLCRRFPSLRVIQGDAAQLGDLLGSDAGRVRTVVSSLPLRSLPPETVRAIAGQLEAVLAPGARFIQFTYKHRALCSMLSERFTTVYSRIIWGNLPPARLDVFQYQS